MTDLQPTCRCRHPLHTHNRPGLAPQCVAPGCPCIQYRPLGGTATDAEPAKASPPTPAPVVKFQPAAAPEPKREIVTDHEDPSETPEKLERQPDEPTNVGPSALAALDIHFLLREAKTRTPRIRARAQKIEQLLAELNDQVQEDSQAATARAEISQLEQRLALAKAKLRKPKKVSTRPAKANEPGSHECPECAEQFTSAQGLGAHRARKHGYRKAAAS